MKALLGITVPVEQKFRCILPGHQPDRTPSAALSPAPETGEIVYRCWQRGVTYPLARVYQALVAGRPIDHLPWSDEMHVVWKVRCLLNTGQIHPPPLALPTLPSGSDPLIVQHFSAVISYFQVREMTAMGLPAPFTPTFVGPWCSISVEAAKELRHRLRAAHVIKKTRRWKNYDLYDLVSGS
jgi:hypothetical protein